MTSGETFDWPSNPVGLRELDTALRCNICYDFFNVPKAIPCGHTFCSDCIRGNGDYQQQNGRTRNCPECRAPWEEADLDNMKTVHSLGQAAAAFQSVRELLLDSIKDSYCPAPKRTRQSTKLAASSRPPQRKRHCPSNASTSQAASPGVEEVDLGSDIEVAESTDDSEDGDEDDDDSDFAVEVPTRPSAARPAPQNLTKTKTKQQARSVPVNPPKGCGLCPICQRVMSLAFLPAHVESCLLKDEVPPIPPASIFTQGKKAAAARRGADSVDLTCDPVPAASRGKLPNPPPKLCFNIMKERDIRRKLQEVGLSPDGDKKAMQKRYQAFRLFVQTARDRGEMVTMDSLLGRFGRLQYRHQNAVEAAPYSVHSVPGAVAEYDDLVAAAQRHKILALDKAQHSLGGSQSGIPPTTRDPVSKYTSQSSITATESARPAASSPTEAHAPTAVENETVSTPLSPGHHTTPNGNLGNSTVPDMCLSPLDESPGSESEPDLASIPRSAAGARDRCPDGPILHGEEGLAFQDSPCRVAELSEYDGAQLDLDFIESG